MNTYINIHLFISIYVCLYIYANTIKANNTNLPKLYVRTQ